MKPQRRPALAVQRIASVPTALLLLSLVAAGCRRKVDAGEVLADAAAAAPAPVWTPPSAAGSAGAPAVDVKMGPLSFAPVARAADPSVVTIYTVTDDDPSAPLGRAGHGRSARGLGTGFIIDADGVVATNNHVVDGANEILVQLSDERRFPAKVIGRDARTDVAVVRIDGVKGLPVLPFGDSDALEVGDWVVAIGNPFGLSHTVSAGIVSAKGRGRDDVPLDPSGYYDFVQTDASINPGNSGGPLLDLRGQVVGMNTAIRGGGAQGIGFAIPVNMMKQLLGPLIRDGKVTRSALGVRIRDVRDLAPEDKRTFVIDTAHQNERGAVVDFVEPNGPADKANLEVGDVIVGFGGQTVDRGSLLQWLVSTAGVGATVPIRVVRRGEPKEISATLSELREPQRTGR